MLSGIEIKNRLNKDIKIEPFDERQLNPNSYNVCLANELYLYNEEVLDTKKKLTTTRIIIPEEGLVLKPNRLYIGHTTEYTETYGLVPMITGRNSISKLGLNVNAGGGFGNVGFKGTWSLQLIATAPVRIYPNMEIAQIYYEELTGNANNYTGEFNNQ